MPTFNPYYSVRYFLDSGYAVIFLHRRGSLEPYLRHLQHINVLDLLVLQEQKVFCENVESV